MTRPAPAISLVVPTKGAQLHAEQLLQSLERQSSQDFELIVVDQNPSPVIAPLLERNWRFPITYVHTPGESGISRARNVGLARAKGEFLLFPDDDCWYPDDLLGRALQRLKTDELDALTGRSTGIDGATARGRFEKTAQWINRANVWTTQIEWLAFWRRDLVERLGGFDELIGIGAHSPWHSAEGQDLMLRALRGGARCWYDPDLNAHDHGMNPRDADAAFVVKARAYGRGFGYVIRKHRLGLGTACYFIARSLGGVALALARGQRPLARFYAATALGRAEGILGRCFGKAGPSPKLSEGSPHPEQSSPRVKPIRQL